MKALLLFLFACTACFAQEFTVLPTGLASKKDVTKNYVIAYSAGTADTLYAVAKTYISSKFTGSKDQVRTDDAAKVIVYETADMLMATVNKKKEDVTYTTSFTCTLEFKDGKVKITYSNVNIFIADLSKEKKPFQFASIYNASGKVVEIDAKKLIETHFNASTKLLLAAFKSYDEKKSSDW